MWLYFYQMKKHDVYIIDHQPVSHIDHPLKLLTCKNCFNII